MKKRLKLSGWFILAFISVCISPIWGAIWIVTGFDIVKYIQAEINKVTHV